METESKIVEVEKLENTNENEITVVSNTICK